jgi:hypothetical protein
MKPGTTYEKQFLDGTSAQRRSIKARSAAKYSSDEKRLLRPAVPIEFSLEEYRAWVLEQFGDEWGSRACFYECGRYITTSDFVPDHFKPLDRGGANTLTNLRPCCATCNDIKGTIDGPWFMYLLRCLREMPEPESKIIRERLAKSEKAASSVRALRGRNHQLLQSLATREATQR